MERSAKLTNEQLEQLLDMYRKGVSVREIEATLGVGDKCLYYWLKKLGEPLRGHATGSNHRNWKGGRRPNSQGYIRVWVDPSDPFAVMVPKSERASHVLEHRLVMARSLGRPLRDDETVHHINGDKTDNRIENLQLRVGKHGTGVSLVCAACGSADLIHQEIQ